MPNYRFNVILPHKKFTWTDFGRVYYIYTLYAPVATPLALKHYQRSSCSCFQIFQKFPKTLSIRNQSQLNFA